MANSNQPPFSNPWNNQSSSQQMQNSVPQQRRSASELELAHNAHYIGQPHQRNNRVGPIRTTIGDMQRTAVSSVSSLSGAMGTAAQQPSNPSARSTGSSPSSDASNNSNRARDFQMQMSEMGISGLSSTAQASQSQDLLSPTHSQSGLLTFDNLNVGQCLNSPYLETPPTALSDLPQTPFNMASPYMQSAPRFGYSNRSGMGPSSPGVQVPLSAPPGGVVFSTISGMPMAASPSPPGLFQSPNDDSENLRKLIHELQMENHHLRQQTAHLQSQLSAAQSQSSQEMELSWRKRTDARIRKFCSPNRAGNALCAWHDTRRERRAYPPRMAPQGTLNCGCTFDEALFEESLARHGVGSYLPGDNVRMDPNLRNPLLRLLKERYAYRDGDFERDPRTGGWVEGEGHEHWENELHSRSGARR